MLDSRVSIWKPVSQSSAGIKRWPVAIRKVILEVCLCHLRTRKKSCRGLQDGSHMLIPSRMMRIVRRLSWCNSCLFFCIISMSSSLHSETLAYVSSVRTYMLSGMHTIFMSPSVRLRFPTFQLRFGAQLPPNLQSFLPPPLTLPPLHPSRQGFHAPDREIHPHSQLCLQSEPSQS